MIFALVDSLLATGLSGFHAVVVVVVEPVPLDVVFVPEVVPELVVVLLEVELVLVDVVTAPDFFASFVSAPFAFTATVVLDDFGAFDTPEDPFVFTVDDFTAVVFGDEPDLVDVAPAFGPCPFAVEGEPPRVGLARAGKAAITNAMVITPNQRSNLRMVILPKRLAYAMDMPISVDFRHPRIGPPNHHLWRPVRISKLEQQANSGEISTEPQSRG